jgi:hypothetical protein
MLGILRLLTRDMDLPAVPTGTGLWMTLLAEALAVTVCALAGALALRQLWRWWRGRTARAIPVLRSRPLEALPLSDELERWVEEHEPAEALGRLWRWLVLQLSAQGRGRADADLTQREFLADVRRRDPSWSRLPQLQRVVEEHERWAFAGHPPSRAELRGMLPRLREVVT